MKKLKISIKAVFIFMELNEYQKKAIESQSRNILLIAAAGSGKTTVIVHRIIDMIKNRGIKAKNIIVITFTKKAALNMEERFNRLSDLKELPFFGTFHSFCYRILLNENYKIKIISEEEKNKLIRGFVNEITGKKMPKSKHINKEVYRIDKVIKMYKSYKEENSLFDFDDLEDEVIKLFEKENIRKKYNGKYTHILVDEFQDCNDKQIHILKRFYDSSVFAVGDEDQCIYTFRGSNPEYMVTFEDHFKEGVKLHLPINYRCSRNIVIMSKNLIKNNKKRNHKDIDYFIDKDGEIKILDHESDKEVYTFLVEKLKSLCSVNTCGVLVRTNREIIPILYNLFKHNIVVNVKDDLSFLDFKIIMDLENLIRLSLDFNDREAFIELAPYLSKIEKESILKDNTPLFNFCKRFSLYKRRRILILWITVSILGIFDKIKLVKVLKYLPYYNNIIDYNEIESILLNLNLNNHNLNDILKFFIYLRSSLYSKKSNITISTIHGIKGMEYDEVHILNACEDFLPINRSGTDIEEERRIFYIAITRAKDKLTIHYIKKYMEDEREKSRFLKELFE